ncbi:MAG: hypothetical protein ABIK82_01195 [Pseudomonadota bacterium]
MTIDIKTIGGKCQGQPAGWKAQDVDGRQEVFDDTPQGGVDGTAHQSETQLSLGDD